MRLITLNIRVEDARLAKEEQGLRIVSWNSAWRESNPRATEVSVPLPLSRDKQSSKDLRLGVVLPGDGKGPWPADANVWIGSHTFAPSVDGPLVGGRSGSGAVSFAMLRDRLTAGKDILLKMFMIQPGMGSGRYRKMNVRILGIEEGSDVVRQWKVAQHAGPYDFVPSRLEMHDDLLVDFVNVSLYPYSEKAARAGHGFAPSHEKIAPIHAPYWVANLPVPGFMFWMQTGTPRYDTAMHDFMKSMSRIAVARHAVEDVQSFVELLERQFEHTDETYDDMVTFAAAVLIDMCAITAVSTFYRYDEAWRVETHWFGDPTAKKKSIESFQDALADAGGDCEDVGSLIHRIFRWLQLGDPEYRSSNHYWRAYGGWNDPLLNSLQHLAYWYVSCGALGSVTSARFVPEEGEVPQLLIRSDRDENLPVGGHMWQEAMPVTKVEELLRRMNPDNVPEGTLRPRHPGRYPGWIKFLPHAIGEGTGSVYPLVLPLVMYMHKPEGKEMARVSHEQMIRVLTRIQEDTKLLRSIQIQRFSDRSTPVSDARVNYFYRRTTKISTDDMALQGIPRFDMVWARMGGRRSEGGRRLMTNGAFVSSSPENPYASFSGRKESADTGKRNPYASFVSRKKSEETRQQGDTTEGEDNGYAFSGARHTIGDIPGEPAPGVLPTWGVDMRDKILTANQAYEGGEAHSNVALVLAPPVTNEQMESFKSRMAQLPPWQQPRRSADVRKNLERQFLPLIADFQEKADGIVGSSADVKGMTQINCIFRRNEFTDARYRSTALADLSALSDRSTEGPHVHRVRTAFEFIDDSVYNVRVSLFMG